MTALVVVAATVIAACGGSDAGDTDPPPTPTVLASSTTAPPTTTAPSSTTAGPTTTVSPPITTTTTIPLVPLAELELTWTPIAEGFDQPVLVATAPGDVRLHVVDQSGVIWILDGETPIRFLDIRDLVAFRGERGLLGLAFHPEYDANDRFFVNYIDNSGNSVVAEYTRVSAEAADVTSERIILEVDQPASNHNGGMIDFGSDGYLWIGFGDGGGANDRYRQGQRADTLLGAMVRIDVDGGDPYAVPTDNPFADGVDGAPEVWATGVRNPWRWSFDGERIYIGDVGQNEREEISVADVAEGGLNYGWPIMEATACFQRSGCDQTGLVLPVIEYRHGEGCSVTGGYVYRGSAIPELEGHYFYGDYCRGWVRSALIDESGNVVESIEWSPPATLPSLTSFGIDADGELYATTVNGTVWRLDRS
jgi:glucose/arabinose dehydrogenase